MQVNVSTSLLSVLAISEFSHTIDLKLGITLEWYENRVLYHNLKAEEALNTLTKSEVRCKGKPLTKLHAWVPSWPCWALFLRYAIFYFPHLRFAKQQFSRYLHNKYCKRLAKSGFPTSSSGTQTVTRRWRWMETSELLCLSQDRGTLSGASLKLRTK